MNDALLHGLPVLIVVGLFALIYVRTAKRPPAYRLSQAWTHAPILWSATDEVIPDGHGHHDHDGRHEAHGDPAVRVGGGASGRW